MNEREFARDVVRKLREAGYESYWAGGCVRDQCLGLEPADYDVATSARPENVIALFPRSIQVGIAFGVVEVLGPRPYRVQVATFRIDGDYTGGRRPDSVSFCSAKEDALRRDFTINGMFYDPLSDTIIDYVGGRDDLAAGLIRAIGDPVERFQEDKLRLLRAPRFAARFRFAIAPATRQAIIAMADTIRVISAERITDELHKMLIDNQRLAALNFLVELQLLAPVLPELAELPMQAAGDDPQRCSWPFLLKIIGQMQPPVWPKPRPISFPLVFAALLHCSGPKSSHQTQGPVPAKRLRQKFIADLCQRLRISNQEKQSIEWLVLNQEALNNARSLPFSTLKPILSHSGIGELLSLHQACALARGHGNDDVEYCLDVLRTLPPERVNPPPLVTGYDLQALGMRPGPDLRRYLAAVRDDQLNEMIASKEEALDLVQKWLYRDSQTPHITE